MGRQAWGAPVCLALGNSPHMAQIEVQAIKGVKKHTRGALNAMQCNAMQCNASLHLNRKRMFTFGHCQNHLNPLPQLSLLLSSRHNGPRNWLRDLDWIWQQHGTTCISSNLATRWRHLHYLNICPPDGTTSITCKFGHHMAQLGLVQIVIIFKGFSCFSCFVFKSV